MSTDFIFFFSHGVSILMLFAMVTTIFWSMAVTTIQSKESHFFPKISFNQLLDEARSWWRWTASLMYIPPNSVSWFIFIYTNECRISCGNPHKKLYLKATQLYCTNELWIFVQNEKKIAFLNMNGAVLMRITAAVVKAIPRWKNLLPFENAS